MTAQALIAICGILGSIAALYLAKRAHDRSFRATEPDEELVKRFVESAPVYRLKDITSAENFEDIARKHQTLGSRDAPSAYERLRTMYVYQARQKGWYVVKAAWITGSLNACWKMDGSKLMLPARYASAAQISKIDTAILMSTQSERPITRGANLSAKTKTSEDG